LERAESGESSAVIRERVVNARRIQAARYRGLKGVVANADVPSRLLKDVCRLTDAAHAHLRRQVERLNLSARAYDRILRVARTAADLKGREAVTEEEVLEAAGYRALDRENGFWA
jgi:magnesium chelatase family protein